MQFRAIQFHRELTLAYFIPVQIQGPFKRFDILPLQRLIVYLDNYQDKT